MFRLSNHTVTAVLSIVLFVSCNGRSTAQGRANDRPSLIVVPGAEHVRFTNDYDGGVAYDLVVPHPAISVIDSISAHLRDQGWKARTFDLFDPGIPTSHLDGWGKYLDKSGRLVRIWHGEWTDSGGAYVEYGFSYKLSPDREGRFVPNHRLEVIGIYMSAKTVASVKQSKR